MHIPLNKCMCQTWYGSIISMKQYEPVHEISNNVVCVTSKASDQPAHTRSLIRAFASRLKISMIVKLLTEHHLEFLSLKEAEKARPSLNMSKCLMHWLNYVLFNFLSFSLSFQRFLLIFLFVKC